MDRLHPARLLCLAAPLLLACVAAHTQEIPLPAAGVAEAAAFDAANKLYEQGKFAEAAAAYQQLLRSAPRSETVWFNLGNAWFKAGEVGRAIAAYCEAEQIAPRDPAVRFNLQFARRKVSGGDAPAGPAWRRALGALTLNEWTMLGSAALWLWFGLLALREWRPALRPVLSGYTATSGVLLLALIGCTVLAGRLRTSKVVAVVVAPEAIVRSGPLEEAKVLHQFRDGIEVTVLDRKDFGTGDQKLGWLQVRDAANRSGWLKGDQVTVLGAGR